jgi:hypothetical protein
MVGSAACVGGGTPFLPPVAEHVPPDLIETRTFGSRARQSSAFAPGDGPINLDRRKAGATR